MTLTTDQRLLASIDPYRDSERIRADGWEAAQERLIERTEGYGRAAGPTRVERIGGGVYVSCVSYPLVEGVPS